MSKVTISICDLCKTEQRSDTDVYWAYRFGGPIVLDFKAQAGIQTILEYETMCTPCARRIFDLICREVTAIVPIDKNSQSSE